MRLISAIRALALLAMTPLPIAGCASRGSADLLEARLREQEDQLGAVEQRLERAQAELTAARRANQELQLAVSESDQRVVPAELLEQQFRVTGIKIDSLLTGGLNRDDEAGDDLLIVVFVPVDDAGQSVILPGRVRCELLDPTLPSDQQLLGTWNFNESQTRSAWQTQLGKSAFRLELPWQTSPPSVNLVVRVQLETTHGDQFETSQPVTIALR